MIKALREISFIIGCIAGFVATLGLFMTIVLFFKMIIGKADHLDKEELYKGALVTIFWVIATLLCLWLSAININR